MPEGLRFWLARFKLWRLRQAKMLKTSMLGLFLAVQSGLLGYLIAQPKAEIALMPTNVPGLGSALPGMELPANASADDISAYQWGTLQAELVRLRLLYRRIVEITELQSEDFALSVELADERYSDSLMVGEERRQPRQQEFALAKRTVDHMTSQATLMLSLAKIRDQEHRFTISGSPVVRARITSRFGYRIDPRSGGNQFHRGLDFGGAPGSHVLALADGVVTYSGNNGGYGNLVELEHADGYRTRYAHNDENLVSVGATVHKGQVIAAMGSTGKSTGSHVHVEVRSKGKAVDPLLFISPSLPKTVVAEGEGAARTGS